MLGDYMYLIVMCDVVVIVYVLVFVMDVCLVIVVGIGVWCIDVYYFVCYVDECIVVGYDWLLLCMYCQVGECQNNSQVYEGQFDDEWKWYVKVRCLCIDQYYCVQYECNDVVYVECVECWQDCFSYYIIQVKCDEGELCVVDWQYLQFVKCYYDVYCVEDVGYDYVWC